MVYQIRGQRGFSLTELLVVVALIAIIMGVTVFSYRTSMRASRVKQAVSDLYDGFVRARSQAILQNGDVTVRYDTTTRTVTFARSGTVLNRVVLSNQTTDPGKPDNQGDYHFEPLTVVRSATRSGATAITGLDVDGDNTPDSIPILSDAAVNITISQDGFINGVGNAAAILLMHQNDIDEGDTSGERQYAVVLFSTGLVKKVRQMPDGTWELF